MTISSKSQANSKKILCKIWAFCMALQMCCYSSLPVLAATPKAPACSKIKPPTQIIDTTKIKTAPRGVRKIAARTLANGASDAEISLFSIGDSQLIPIAGSKNQTEDADLVKAINDFRQGADWEKPNALVSFAASHPKSRWQPALQSTLGDIYFKTGYLTKADKSWSNAWNATKSSSGKNETIIANRAVANLCKMLGRVGRKQELESLFKEIGKRQFLGSDEEKIVSAREGLGLMARAPRLAYKCGPHALAMLYNLDKPQKEISKVITDADVTSDGTTLAQLQKWSDELGMQYQMAKRSPGAPMIDKSVMHWGMSHFAAVMGKRNGKFVIKDNTFGEASNFLISQAAIDAESDGYFLIPKVAQLPSGWSPVPIEEAQKVHGKGNAVVRNGDATSADYPKACPPDSILCKTGCPKNEKSKDERDPAPYGGGSFDDGGSGVPGSDNSSGNGPSSTQGNSTGIFGAAINKLLTTTLVQGVPNAYQPPIGPSVDYTVTYSDLQTNQPAVFGFPNFGLNWNFQYVSYLTIDPVSSQATVRLPNGGSYVYNSNGSGGYDQDILKQTNLVVVGGGVYHRVMPDGSKQIYSQADSSSPPRIFMTEMQNAQGQSVYIQYDANYRITNITDFSGLATTVQYVSNTFGNAGYYKIAAVVDPYGRSTQFGYDASLSRLISVTSPIGLQSKFVYDNASTTMKVLTTPYGSTSFSSYTPNSDPTYVARGKRTTYADGTASVVENWLDEPKTTYCWDRHQLQLYPDDPANHVYTHCETTRFTSNFWIGWEEATIQSVKQPLEAITYYTYPSAFLSPNYAGNINVPKSIKQDIVRNYVMPSIVTITGTPTAGSWVDVGFQYYYARYNVQAGDTLDDIATGLAKAINNNSDLQWFGVRAGGTANQVYLRANDAPYGNSWMYSSSSGSGLNIIAHAQQQQSCTYTIAGTFNPGDVQTFQVFHPDFPHAGYEQFTHTAASGETLHDFMVDFATQINANSFCQDYRITAEAVGDALRLKSW